MSTSPTLYSPGKPALKDWGGSKRTFGNRKRPLAMRLAVQAAANAVQPTGSDQRNRRRVKPEGSAAAAFGAGAAGAAAAGAAAATGAGATGAGAAGAGAAGAGAAGAGAAGGALGGAAGGVGGLSWPSVMKSCLVALGPYEKPEEL
jgi:hypothetical protein